MKKAVHIFVVFFTLITLTLCDGSKKNEENPLRIEVQVPSGDYDSLYYHLSKTDFAAYSISGFTREYFDSTGNVSFDIETNRIGKFFMTLFPNKYDHEVKMKSRVYMLLRPGDTYKIEFDSSHPLLFRIHGDYEEAQNLYNQFNHSNISGSPRTAWYTNTDSLPDDLLHHLEDSINRTLEPFQNLYNAKAIDEEYYNTIKAQIQYSHADALLDHLEVRQMIFENPKFKRHFEDVSPIDLSLMKKLSIEKEIFIRYPPSSKEARILFDFNRYIDKYLKYKARLDLNMEFYKGSYEGDLINVNAVSEFFDNDVEEYYFAKQFGIAFSQQGPDSLATFLFAEFKDRFPDSPYMPGIVRAVEGLTGYYAAFYPGLDESNKSFEEKPVSMTPVFSPEVKFKQYQDTITSFNSLISQFEGKNLFVDFWASWCPPCRYELRFADSLHMFLQDHNIEMLYISSDEYENKWLNVIHNYDLKGSHIRVTNPKLRKELREMVDFIPTYMIIDSTGRIVVLEAERPHTKTKLYDQLLESLK